MNRFEVPRGTRDFLPDEMVVRKHVERVVCETFDSFGFQQVQTPTFESFDLFAARSGEEIRESMFTFASDAGRYALRPELTAPICRLAASGILTSSPSPYKLYYCGACFRYCKPQAGRYREFYQAGTELLGAADELADAEVIALAVKVLRKLGISEFRLKIGNVGVFQKLLSQQNVTDNRLRKDWEVEVIHDIDRLMHTTELCQAMARRDELRPQDIAFVSSERSSLHHIQGDIDYRGEFEVLPGDNLTGSKLREQLEWLPKAAEDTLLQKWVADLSLPDETGKLLLKVAHIRGPSHSVIPQAKALLGNTVVMESLHKLSRVAEMLAAFGVRDYEVVLGTVRNLDFYTGTVFEIDSELLGAQKQICGGGRYDNLVQEFGGDPMPATGFAFGFDRLVEVFKKSTSDTCVSRAAIDVLIICDENLRGRSIEVAEDLRNAGLRVGIDLCGRSLEGQREYAGKLKWNDEPLAFCVVLDSEGIAAGKCKLRQMVKAGPTEQELPVSAVADEIQRRINLEK